MAAPTFVSGHTVKVDAANALSRTITVPTNTTNDIIILAVVTDSATGTISATGFNFIYQDKPIQTGTPVVTAIATVMWKVSAADSGTYTIATSVTERVAAICFAVRGAQTGSIHATGTAVNGDSATATVPAVTTSVVDCLRISIVGSDGAITTTGTPSGHTLIDAQTGTSAGGVSCHYKTLTASGTDASATISLTATEQWVGFSFALAPLSGTLFTQTVAGTLTSSGAIVKKPIKVLTGTLTSSGAIVRKVFKVLAGTLTSAGTIVKKTFKTFAGTLTSSGTLTSQIVRIYLQVVGGTLTSSGALVRKTFKPLAGTLTSVGTVSRRTNKLLAGTLTSSGAIVRKTFKIVAGTLASSGAIAKKTFKIFAGTLTSAGSLATLVLAPVLPTIAAVALTLASRTMLTVEQRARAWTLASRTGLTLSTRLRTLTVAIRNALTVKEKG